MIDLKRMRYWIFDLDGTLTVKAHDFIDIRKKLGIPIQDDIITFLSRLPENEQIRLWQLLDDIEKDIAQASRPAIGVLTLLKNLSYKSVKLGILTRNTRENAIITLEKIGLKTYFPDECILGREESNPKPDPDGIYKLLDLWGGKPDLTIMAGDYLYDLQAGRAAGTHTLYIDPEGQFPFQDVSDIHTKTLDEIVKYVI